MSVVMDGSPVVWLELIVLVWVWEETLSPLSELPSAGGRQGASELADVGSRTCSFCCCWRSTLSCCCRYKSSSSSLGSAEGPQTRKKLVVVIQGALL